MLDLMRRLAGRPRTAEDDVAPDTAVARTRETGGDRSGTDVSASTTAVGPSGGFVGRIAGEDECFGGETGAEARARERRD